MRCVPTAGCRRCGTGDAANASCTATTNLAATVSHARAPRCSSTARSSIATRALPAHVCAPRLGAAQEQKARRFRERSAGCAQARRTSCAPTSCARQAGRSRRASRPRSAARTRTTFDFDAMSRMLVTSAPRSALPAARRSGSRRCWRRSSRSASSRPRAVARRDAGHVRSFRQLRRGSPPFASGCRCRRLAQAIASRRARGRRRTTSRRSTTRFFAAFDDDALDRDDMASLSRLPGLPRRERNCTAPRMHRLMDDPVVAACR